jgi:hypothetical protein
MSEELAAASGIVDMEVGGGGDDLDDLPVEGEKKKSQKKKKEKKRRSELSFVAVILQLIAENDRELYNVERVQTLRKFSYLLGSGFLLIASSKSLTL